MTIYSSKAQGAFFDDRVHGAREISVVDQEQLERDRALIVDREAALPDLPADERAAAEEAIDALRLALDTHSPMMLIPNPDCRLPDDAIEISDDAYRALLAGQVEGRAIAWGDDGAPHLQDRAAPSAEEVIASVKRKRDLELAASDHTQLPDAPLTAAKKKAWAAHRQRLRDLPKLVADALAAGRDPAEITYPEPPA